jgi:galactokinase
MSFFVEVVNHLSEVYAFPEKQKERYQHLISKFKTLFNVEPQFISRSPGRVNLIGEHIGNSTIKN